jgi:membrane-associated phospholipid phosphatase
VKELHSRALIMVLACCAGVFACGQQAAVSNPQPVATTQAEEGLLAPGEDAENRLGVPFLRHLVGDQQRFWQSFTGVSEKKNWFQVAPFLATTGTLIAADSWISRQVSSDPSSMSRSSNISNYGAYSFLAAGGSAYVLGALTKNSHVRETGFLAGEAAINASGVSFLLKGITQRPRPFEGDGNGSFFQGGSSFPSEHTAIAWSMASVFAHEYPGPLSKFLAYGLATAVTFGRVTSRQHFSSDVWVGSALGWYVGRQVYRAHHDVELGGAPWGSEKELIAEKERNPAYMASAYVPSDSWIYPALERVIAQGYIHEAFLGMRPWTRMQCAEMVQEAESDERFQGGDTDAAAEVVRSLQNEFSSELRRIEGSTANRGVSLDSLYTRVAAISGTPLRDGYHFGQTIIDDFGRPYGEGVNAVAGASIRAEAGPLALYIRGEYQQAGSVPSPSLNALNQIAISDFRLLNLNAAPPGYSIYAGTYDRFRLLEGTVSLAARNLQFTFGKQSLWLGPGDSGPLLFSNNAEPIAMLRIDTVSPYRVPLLSSFLGAVRSEYFLGQLSGHQWIYQPPTLYGPGTGRGPFIQGLKSSFKPTENLELGFGFSAMFAGPGLPFTWSEFVKSFYSHKANLAENPGKRFSSFDFSYRIPKLRNRLSVFVDSLVVDEFSPIGSTRPSLNTGLRLAKVPKLANTELRVEGFKTDHPAAECCFPGSVYYDLRYVQGYTNNGNIMGSWIGRGGYGADVSATHWFSPRTKIEFGYRHQEVDREFLGGGRANRGSIAGDLNLKSGVTFSTFLQYERWYFPLLYPLSKSDFTASFQINFTPKFSWR